MCNIAIINYNVGNLCSIKNAIDYIGHNIDIVNNPKDIQSYNKIILPGVGAFNTAMEYLKKSGMDEEIKRFANENKPILGICLGMQLLFEKSYEFGEYKGLGLIKGEIIKFKHHLKIPHIGWNKINIIKNNILFEGISDCYMYFVHSFYIPTNSNTIATTNYGIEFSAIVNKNNIYGIQSHPEKSSKTGLKILKNFMELA